MAQMNQQNVHLIKHVEELTISSNIYFLIFASPTDAGALFIATSDHLRESPVPEESLGSGESSKLSPNSEESFRGEFV